MSPDHAWFSTATPAIKEGVSPVLLKSKRWGLTWKSQSPIAFTRSGAVSFDVHWFPGQALPVVSVYGVTYGDGVNPSACCAVHPAFLAPKVNTSRWSSSIRILPSRGTVVGYPAACGL